MVAGRRRGSWPVHPQYQNRFLDLCGRALQTRQPFPVEVPLRRHDGVFRWVRGGGTPRVLTDGGFAGFVMELTDASDYSEAAAERTDAGQPED